MRKSQRLLVSVRGKNEAIEASKGGAHIIDAEYPANSLGTCYPLNIYTIRKSIPRNKLVSTNIGEKQFVWSTAAQAALGVAFAGADIIKVGLAELKLKDATEIMTRVVRNVKCWRNFRNKQLIATFFADPKLTNILDPITDSIKVARKSKSEGILIDTFDKSKRKGLLDYFSQSDISRFVKNCHSAGLEAWVAGSIRKEQLSVLWASGVDVICVREAACERGQKRMGIIKERIVKDLVRTIPKK